MYILSPLWNHWHTGKLDTVKDLHLSLVSCSCKCRRKRLSQFWCNSCRDFNSENYLNRLCKARFVQHGRTNGFCLPKPFFSFAFNGLFICPYSLSTSLSLLFMSLLLWKLVNQPAKQWKIYERSLFSWSNNIIVWVWLMDSWWDQVFLVA